MELALAWFILILVENRCGYPTPGRFLTQSTESLEKKRVQFLMSAKKCKRVRKDVNTKEIGIGKRGQAVEGMDEGRGAEPAGGYTSLCGNCVAVAESGEFHR
jgi:hypothetical protein